MLTSPRKRIFICAPYTREALGAARKIENIIQMFVHQNYRVCLIVTSHQYDTFSKTKVTRLNLNGLSVPSIVLFTLPWRPLGKMLNALTAFDLGIRLAKKKFALVWLYNGYLFEMLFMAGMLRKKSVLGIIELEDWPTSRAYGFRNIKNWLDYVALRMMLKRAALITCINSVVEERVRQLGAKQTLLFPTFISTSLLENFQSHEAFSAKSRVFGYFGGLNTEKGADVILDAIRELPEDTPWRAIVTGCGPLSSQFSELHKQFPNRLDFKGMVDASELAKSIACCDVIINPHRPLEQFGSGILPFKLTEALASKRLLISTTLGKAQMDASRYIIFFNGTSAGLIATLNNAEQFYRENVSAIQNISASIIEQYSEYGFYAQIMNKLSGYESINE